ncbi:hypothetical protein A1359_18085 [Methylomonas lenta]|uniref:DUF4124 domain-containing protein n=1 Tax=Methylomonas lenta TaxID=980561 RepID=A0A177MYA3_9GAMM|nr:DUF4124 domain-containing protein [Methylomonas lenta]OAI09889.1 hypothetical protein A1359_18085 [Methylomonas lenta]
MRLISLLSLMLISATANAEVFKCIEKFGRAVYQSTPCKSGAKEQQLDIKADPAKEAAAESNLEAVQSEYESRKVAQDERNKELEKQRMEAATLEIARRNAIAQQEQADAQKRQAEALEQQNNYNNRPLYIVPSVRPPWPASKPPTPFPEPRRPRSAID